MRYSTELLMIPDSMVMAFFTRAQTNGGTHDILSLFLEPSVPSIR